MDEIIVKPVGRVEVSEGIYSVKIYGEFIDAMKGLEGFGHINVIFWGDQADTKDLRKIRTVNKPYKEGPEKIGIFATRSQFRPNPVLTTPCEIISMDMEKGIILLSYIDADDKSPVIDIKPYLPCIDRVREIRQPDWCSSWPEWYEDSALFNWSSVFNF